MEAEASDVVRVCVLPCPTGVTSTWQRSDKVLSASTASAETGTAGRVRYSSATLLASRTRARAGGPVVIITHTCPAVLVHTCPAAGLVVLFKWLVGLGPGLDPNVVDAHVAT
jgi:hypothetical protein